MSLKRFLQSSFRRGQSSEVKRTVVYFTSDIHGSTKCFRKFLNTPEFYGADVIIMGGDITGKMVVPIIREMDGTHTCDYMGVAYRVDEGPKLEDLETLIQMGGHYPYLTDNDEMEELQSEEAQKELFAQVIEDSFAEWIELAEERIRGTGVRCFITLGNDDTFAIDRILNASTVVENPEGKCVFIDEHHEMISTGWSNPTPWHTPRECSEEAMAEKIEAMMSQVSRPDNLIMNMHCPPFDYGLDVARELTDDLQVKTEMGQPIFIPVGSTAVREAIERHQPLLGLHGHIHESRGFCKIGRTLCLNPGSSYTEGLLDGALVVLNEEGIVRHQLVSG
jgi:Icc-related predicted phosphoesterase